MNKINKSELIEIVADKAYLTKKDVVMLFDALFDTIKEAMEEGKEVNITNFGSFVPIKKEARKGTNPKTHEIITIESTNTVSFRLSGDFKKQLNK